MKNTLKHVLILASLTLVSMTSAAQGQALDDLYKNMEYIDISPVQRNGQEIDADSAAFVCSSLGYTLVDEIKLKGCSKVDAEILTAVKFPLSPNGSDYGSVGTGAAVVFKKYGRNCTLGKYDYGVFAKDRLTPVLSSLRCGRPLK